MKNLRKYLLMCMREEPGLPELLSKITEEEGHSKILDYNTHSVSIINTPMTFNKLSLYLTHNLDEEHYFLVQLKSNTNVTGSIPLAYAKQLFNEDGLDDIIFFLQPKTQFLNQPFDFTNKLKEAMGNLEKSIENIPQLDASVLIDSIKEMESPTFDLDDLLDKINDKGMESLTPFEVDFLNKQSSK